MRRTVLALVFGLAATPAFAQFELKSVLKSLSEQSGAIVDSLMTRTEKGEQKVGAECAAMLLGAAPLVDDAALQAYVNRVGLWLALHSERPQLAWRFGVIDTPNINAFAAPGGYVLVTKGLMAQLADEAELAGVLAHEIAHVVKKHHLNALLKSQGVQLGTKELEGLASEKIGQQEISSKVLGGFKEISLRGLDKSDEYQADRMALVLAARAGYDPFGLPRVLRKLEAISAQDSALALLFETHPPPRARLDALEIAAGEKLDAFAAQPVFAERFKASVQLR